MGVSVPIFGAEAHVIARFCVFYFLLEVFLVRQQIALGDFGRRRDDVLALIFDVLANLID